MPKTGGLSKTEAKRKVLDGLAAGLSVTEACEAAGRKRKAYENWRSEDPEYGAACDEARARRKRALEAGKDADVYQLDFATWRKRFLGMDTYPHQRQWIDVLEGRDPQPIEGCDWEPSNPKRLIINVPPGFSKSTTITVDYTTYRICMNPNISVVIVSKRQEQAKKFLYQIKQRLTSPMFAELQAAYAPEGGFRPAKGEGTFGASQFYVAGRERDAKDPTVEALGIGGQIYGTRSDLIILDDCVVGTNAGEYEKQIYWLESEVDSRIKNGKILVVGTRLATTDLYSELRNGDRYEATGKSPWSYLRQPMVLNFADDPKDWKTLWPKSTTPYDVEDTEPDENGEYVMFDGPTCARIRDSKPANVWALVYQQQQVADDSVFHPVCVNAAIDRRRKAGPMRPGEWGGRRDGMQGLHVIGSIDPAGTGEAFIMVYAVERSTGERWVLNCWMGNQTTPAWYAQRIEDITPEYRVDEWVIESNGYSNWLIHDDRIVDYLRNRGIPLSPHYTSKNKLDPDFGVASMSSLFGSTRRHVEGGRMVHNGDHKIHLPDPDKCEGVRALIEQLIAWQPGKQGKQLRQDGPMSMWFAELRARNVIVGKDGQRSYLDNPYLSRKDRQKQYVVPLHSVA